jgi:hypothetical protein
VSSEPLIVGNASRQVKLRKPKALRSNDDELCCVAVMWGKMIDYMLSATTRGRQIRAIQLPLKKSEQKIFFHLGEK